MRSLLKLSVAFVALVACTADAPESTATGEAAVAVARIANTCGAPQVSADGAYALFSPCTIDRAVRRLDVDRGRVDQLVSLGTVIDHYVQRVGATGRFGWTILMPADDLNGPGWSVVVRDLTNPEHFSAKVIKPVFADDSLPSASKRSASGEPGTIAFTPDQTQIAFLSGYSARFLTVAGTATNGPGQLLDLGETFADRTIAMAPDGSHLLVLKTARIGAPATVRRVDLGPVVALGPEVAVALRDANVLANSYDGRTLLAHTPKSGSVEGSLVTVDPTSGAVTTLDTPATLESLGEVDGALLYLDASTQKISRVARDGSAPVVLADAGSAWAQMKTHLSSNGAALLYTLQRNSSAGSRRELWSVPTDGTAPPTHVSDWGFELSFTQSADGRVLALDEKGWKVSVLDDVTGATRVTYETTFADWRAQTYGLSADGTSVFRTRSCRVADLDGLEVVRMSGSEEVLVPCQLGYRTWDATFTQLPHRSSMLLTVKDAYGHDGWSVLLRP